MPTVPAADTRQKKSARTTARRTTRGVAPARVLKRAAEVPKLAHFEPASPWARLQPTLASFDLAEAPTRETFLARETAVVVGKDGIEFGSALWSSPRLRRHTSVPRSSKAKRPTLHLLYDAAARSRGALEEVTLLVLDEHGCVRERIRCTPRSDAQRRSDRDEERATQLRYEAALETRRAALERHANVTLTGQGAGVAQDQLAVARKAQGRPGELRARATTRAAADKPARAAGRADAAARTRGRSAPPKSAHSSGTSSRGKATSSKRADAPAAPMRGAFASTASTVDASPPKPSQDKWAAFSALLEQSTRARGRKSD